MSCFFLLRYSTVKRIVAPWEVSLGNWMSFLIDEWVAIDQTERSNGWWWNERLKSNRSCLVRHREKEENKNIDRTHTIQINRDWRRMRIFFIGFVTKWFRWNWIREEKRMSLLCLVKFRTLFFHFSLCLSLSLSSSFLQ